MKYEINEDGKTTYRDNKAPSKTKIAELLVRYGDGRVGFDKQDDLVVFRFMSRNYREKLNGGHR